MDADVDPAIGEVLETDETNNRNRGDGLDRAPVQVVIENVPPVADAGGPYLISEGDALLLDASGSVDADGDPLTYAWDLDADGTFDDAIGVNPTIDWLDLINLGISDNGSFTISLRVDDGQGAVVEADAALTVANAAPVASITGRPRWVPGVELNLSLRATDPSPDDEAAAFNYTVNWGDGTPNEIIVGTANEQAAHTYDAVGLYTVEVTATDKDAGVSAIATHGIEIAHAARRNNDLVVSGTQGNDTITIEQGSVVVTLNNVVAGTFDDVTGRIIVFGLAGDDTITVDSAITLEVELFGGEGDDVLTGGGGTNTVIGGPGNNTYVSGGGSDVFAATSGSTRPEVFSNDYQTDEDAPLIVPAALGVLANDVDLQADLLTAVVVSGPTSGSLILNADGSFTYTPNADFAGDDSFTYVANDGTEDSDVATVNILVNNLVDLSGRVFDDLDNNGAFDTGELGIAGFTVRLFDQTLGDLISTETTAADGTYSFNVNLGPGTYKLVEVQADDFLDGDETAGALGGTVDNTQESNDITDIVVVAGNPDAGGYLFADIRPSEIIGLVYEDFNDDGEVNFGEKAIAGVTVNLSGTDDRGTAVSVAPAASDVDGIYMFIDLRPGSYTLTEVQPAGFVDGKDTLGTVNGLPSGFEPVEDGSVFAGVVLNRPESVAQNYNFGERPPAGGEVVAGQTATIGFWQNKNGQNLIKSLNGGANATQLGNWLAATFPNMYGANAGANNLAGKTNADVAGYYSDLFRRKKKEAEQLGLGGPTKVDAQVIAVAFATYVTNQTLADTTAASYGFLVTETGVGTSTFNVGNNGSAFGVADNSDVTILDLLLATNERSTNGVLYDLDGDGDADDDLETLLRTMANDVYSAINEAGDI